MKLNLEKTLTFSAIPKRNQVQDACIDFQPFQPSRARKLCLKIGLAHFLNLTAVKLLCSWVGCYFLSPFLQAENMHFTFFKETIPSSYIHLHSTSYDYKDTHKE